MPGSGPMTEPGLTDLELAATRQRVRSQRDWSRRLCCLQRVVNELIVAFLGSLPLVTRPQSRPIAPLCSCADTITAASSALFPRGPCRSWPRPEARPEPARDEE